MNNPKVATNRHPVDKLFDVREQLRVLKDEEATLKAQIIVSGNFVGQEHEAYMKTSTQKRISKDLVVAKFGATAAEACCAKTTIEALHLRGRRSLFD